MKKLIILFAISITIAPFVTSFHLNSEENNILNGRNNQLNLTESTNKADLVSLKQFTIYHNLGKGASGSVVHLARKNGGSDNGQFYALKGIPKEDFLEKEREMLEAVSEFQCVSRLHYAFREGNWLFLVLDLAPGGNLSSRVTAKIPDVFTAKLILAELILAVETLHKANITHGDISRFNTLVDSHGHLILTDFGWCSWTSDDDPTEDDWSRFPRICTFLFSKQFQIDNKQTLDDLFGALTEERLPELKSHPFFDGIDWEKVAERKTEPPFEPTEVNKNLGDPLDSKTLFETEIDEESEAALVEKFRNYYFVAPEHRN